MFLFKSDFESLGISEGILQINQHLLVVMYTLESCFHTIFYYLVHFSLAGSTFPLKHNSPLSNVPDETLKTYFDRVQGIYACKACGKTEKSHSNMRYHVESRHYSPGYFCPNCGKRFQIILHRQRHQKTCFLLRTLDIR